ncbi:cytochrome P450 98A2-like [Hevea brasiliensis]|uniref:cytochrome P450 98A2-like n=1 Tax=Hevea brasiliensis TaxID=3981 RepID=UPI0025CD9AE5|nr:cytochrome P450 98A2-like [Hevea brasiliensis]
MAKAFYRLRKIFTLELFSSKGIEALRPIIEGEVRAVVESICKETINPDNHSEISSLRKYFACCSLKQRFVNTLSRHLARRDGLIRAVMEAYWAENKNGGNAKPNLLDSLLGFQENYGPSKDNIRELLWDVTNAGTETSSIVVENATAQLVNNQRVPFRAQEELDRPHWPLLPSTSPNVKNCGCNIPMGANAHVTVRAIIRNPKTLLDPLDFRPKGFLEDHAEIQGHDFPLLPVGFKGFHNL